MLKKFAAVLFAIAMSVGLAQAALAAERTAVHYSSSSSTMGWWEHGSANWPQFARFG